VYLFLEDNRVAYTDERTVFAGWDKTSVINDGRNPAGHLPVATIDGKHYTEHISIARYVARRLGQYGSDIERDYFADAVADAYQEWRNTWAHSLSLAAGSEEKSKHVKEVAPKFAKVFETFLARYPEGPFFTGTQFTFADAAVYQILHDEAKLNSFKVDAATFPLLTKFYAAVEARPNIAAFLSSSRRHE